MRFLFVGYGSIAKRHIENLTTIFCEREEVLAIDILRHAESDDLPGIDRIFTSSDEIDVKYDAVFITNPTSMHYETLAGCLGFSDYFFLEKPAFDRTDYDVEALGLSGKTIYVACPLRYTRVIGWLHENFDFSKANALRVISSSYLPDWRPGIDYRDTYSAHTSQGGGVSIDLIHEWDYVHHLVGAPERVLSAVGKCSDLEIDADDYAVYIGEYPDMVLEMHLDYFGRKALRRLEIMTSEDTVVCDLLRGSIEWLCSGEKLMFEDSRNGFQQRELEHFFDIMSGRNENDNDLSMALRTLELAKGVYE